MRTFSRKKHSVSGRAGRVFHHQRGISNRRRGDPVAWLERMGLRRRNRQPSGSDMPAVQLLLVLFVLRSIWRAAAVVLRWQPGKQEFLWYLPSTINKPNMIVIFIWEPYSQISISKYCPLF